MNPHKVLGRRIVALLIDVVVLLAISAAMFFPFAEKTGVTDANVSVYFNDYALTGGKAGLFFLASLLVTFLYWVVLVGRTGWSPGKLVVGLRVVRSDDGSTPPGMLKAFLRHLVWVADMFPYLIPGLTGFVVALTNPRRRRIGDLAAGTEVVKASAVRARGAQPAAGTPATPSMPAAPAAPPMPAMTAAQPAPAVPESRPEPAPQAATPADWYPDPQGEKRLRYWDGDAWTSHTAD